MLKFDKIKIVSDISNIEIYDEDIFEKKYKNDVLTELRYMAEEPYYLYIEVDFEENELVSDDLNATEYKINFDIDVSQDQIDFVIQYNDELYSEDYIKTFIESINLVLNQVQIS